MKIQCISVLFIFGLFTYEIEAQGGRGEAFREMLTKLRERKKDNPTKIRIGRHDKWQATTPPTTIATTTTTTTTKSKKEQIQENFKAVNPKGFMSEVSEENLKIYKEDKVGDEIVKMEKELRKLQSTCYTNNDCANSTLCCLVNTDDPRGEGKCVVLPHRPDQLCSSLCPCQGELKCNRANIDQEAGVSRASLKCSTRMSDKERMHQRLMSMVRGKITKT